MGFAAVSGAASGDWQLLRHASGIEAVDDSGVDKVLDQIAFSAGDLADTDLLRVIAVLENLNGDLNDIWIEDGTSQMLGDLAYSSEPSVSEVILGRQLDGDAFRVSSQFSNRWTDVSKTTPESGFLSGAWTMRLYASWYAYPGSTVNQKWHWWVYRLKGGA